MHRSVPAGGWGKRGVAGAVALVAAAVCAGCGDPLAGTEYRGEPLFSFSGEVFSFSYMQIDPARLRLSIFWVPSGVLGAHAGELVEQTDVAAFMNFPSSFAISVFHPPRAENLPGGGAGAAVALILLYDDRNGDGVFSEREDAVVGGAPLEAVVYAVEEVPAGSSPTGRNLPAGFSVGSLPMLCRNLRRPTGCGVPLGATCGADAECGEGGDCLRTRGGETFPGGYCALPALPGGCEPETGYWMGLYAERECESDSDCDPDAGMICDLDEGYCMSLLWGAACSSDGDCRSNEGYWCGASVCQPPWPRDDCGVPIGAPCSRDADCGTDGTCLLTAPWYTFPGGYCALRVSNEGCAPEGAVQYEIDTADGATLWFWLRACLADGDCRSEEGYSCDLANQACVPDHSIWLVVDKYYDPWIFCAPPVGHKWYQ